MEIKEGADGKNCWLMWTAMDRQPCFKATLSVLGLVLTFISSSTNCFLSI